MSTVKILSVTPVNDAGAATGAAVTNLLAPDVFDWGLRDVSKAGAGRNQNYKMNKKRVGQSRDIDVEWSYVSLSDGAAILSAFNSEYVSVQYQDALAGGNRTAIFYVSDRLAKGSTLDGTWASISLSLVERDITRV